MYELDREKVIKGLEEAIRTIETHVPERYRGYSRLSCHDAIALLREQEPVKPITQDAWPNPVKVCGSCGRYITYTAGRPRYCPNCGGEMKWDD